MLGAGPPKRHMSRPGRCPLDTTEPSGESDRLSLPSPIVWFRKTQR